MLSDEKFIYKEYSGLNSIIFDTNMENIDGFYEFIDGIEYTFGNAWDNTINVYGTFSHVNSFFIGGRYDYYTSITITHENYRLIKLVLLSSGWISIK